MYIMGQYLTNGPNGWVCFVIGYLYPIKGLIYLPSKLVSLDNTRN